MELDFAWHLILNCKYIPDKSHALAAPTKCRTEEMWVEHARSSSSTLEPHKDHDHHYNTQQAQPSCEAIEKLEIATSYGGSSPRTEVVEPFHNDTGIDAVGRTRWVPAISLFVPFPRRVDLLRVSGKYSYCTKTNLTTIFTGVCQ